MKRQIKIFDSIDYDDNVNHEIVINKWLADNPGFRVHSMGIGYDSADGSMIIAIVYEEEELPEAVQLTNENMFA